MNVFDIIGPIMIGPSSSHTAGAVRLGQIARKILGEDVIQARIELLRVLCPDLSGAWYG